MGLDQWLEGVGDSVAFIEWRKANMIHKWMENNINDGNELENQQLYYLTTKDLLQLKKDIEDVLYGDAEPEEKLPTCSGFFFGSREYDEYYYDELEWTLKQIKDVLNTNDNNSDFTYHAWW